MCVSLLQYGSKKAGGVEHVPPGWDHWFALVRKSQKLIMLFLPELQGCRVHSEI